MELRIVKDSEKEGSIVLLDGKMEIVKPVYDYLKHLKLKDRAFNTLVANGRDLKLYWEFLEFRGLEYVQATPLVIGEFIEYLRSSEPDNKKIVSLYATGKRTARTINRILSTVCNFYKYCCVMQDINNPIVMQDINRPFGMYKSMFHHLRSSNKTHQSIFKVKESHTTYKLMSDKEIESLYEHIYTERDRLIFRILFLTGARIGEVLNLKIENIPYPDCSMQFGILRDIQSKGKNRNLFIPTALLEEIDMYLLEQRCRIITEHSFLFISMQKQNQGNPLAYRSIYEVFKRVSKKAGIAFNFHDLRHTFVTQLVESGMDISIVSIIAGHKHIATTQKYMHISERYFGESLVRYWEKSILIGGGGCV